MGNEINNRLIDKLEVAGYYNKRILEVKEAQIEDLKTIFKIITGISDFRGCVNYIIHKQISEGYYDEKVNSILLNNRYYFIKPSDFIKTYIIKTIDKYNEQIFKMSEGVYKPLNSNLSKIEEQINRKLGLKEIYSINEIIDCYINKPHVTHWRLKDLNKEVLDAINEQNIGIENTKEGYKSRIIAENSIDKIRDILLAKEVNKYAKVIEIQKFLRLPKIKNMEEQEACNRAVKELLNEYGYSNILTTESKITALEIRCQEKYHISLEEYIQKCLETQTRDLEEIRKVLIISDGVWKAILKRYDIKKGKAQRTEEGQTVDSEAELKIDNIFHRYNIPHVKGVKFVNNSGNKEKMYIADWLIDGKIIVEYFGWLDTSYVNYKEKTNNKIRFYSNLINRGIYFVPLYFENLEDVNCLLLKLNQFTGSNFSHLPKIPNVPNFDNILK